MHPLFFELCVESLPAARVAESGGADRIELCSQLSCGGITPAPALTRATVNAVSLPVYVLIRCRPGDFVFSPAEYECMRLQVQAAKDAGASGVALGMLRPGGRVDVERSRALVELARPLGVTFHRAFDESASLPQALEDVIATGADSLLTSGGAPDVLGGAAAIAELERQAAGRIHIIAGGGLRLSNMLEVVRRSGIRSLHGSLTRENGAGNDAIPGLESNLREALRLLRNELRGRELAAREP